MDSFKQWLREPFRADMSALEWFFFIGLLIVLTALWGLILRHIKGL